MADRYCPASGKFFLLNIWKKKIRVNLKEMEVKFNKYVVKDKINSS